MNQQESSDGRQSPTDISTCRNQAVRWISETPSFNKICWLECPRQENVMDLRRTNSYLLLTTAGWESESPSWTPPPPQIASSSSSEQRNVSQLQNEIKGVQNVLISPITRWKLSIPLSPRGAAHMASAGCAAAFANSVRQMTIYQSTHPPKRVTSQVCIRDKKDYRLIQTLHVKTSSINCIDGGGKTNIVL